MAPTEMSVCTVISVETPFFPHFSTASVRAFAAKSCCASSDFIEFLHSVPIGVTREGSPRSRIYLAERRHPVQVA